MKWRIAEIAAPGVGVYLAGTPRVYEVETLWESAEITPFSNSIQIPTSVTHPGRRYRVRVRHEDNTGRWSHWSDPVEFTAGIPDTSVYENNLMITEIMYNPVAPTGDESLISLENDDFEYIELKNISATETLDLTDVSFIDGINFDFSTESITSLAPGEIVLVVKNLAAFEARYGTNLPVTGEYSDSKFSNGGERVVLSYAGSVELHNFSYDDLPPWPAGADGSGPSLSLIDPASAPNHSLAANWTASAEAMGSPGVNSGTCETIAEWNNAHFSVAQLADPNLSGELADADADGIINLLEYAFDTSPALPHALSSLLSAQVVNEGGADYLSISFRRRICRLHLTYTVESSLDLLTWESGPTHTMELVPPVDNGDGTETVTVRSHTPYSAVEREFLRLGIDYIGP
jgi:hypothetical protein